MKVKNLAKLILLSLVSGSVASSRIYRARADNDPIQELQRVTAFINTDDGLKIQCWEIGDFLPSNSNADGTVRAMSLAGNIDISLFSFAPSVTLFSFDHRDGLQSNAIDLRSGHHLFTVKDGLILIEAHPDTMASRSEVMETYVFADLNGDDWFYFEDTTGSSSVESCARPQSKAVNPTTGTFSARTISGSDTTLISFAYRTAPKHKVVHEGRCNFAGISPVPQSQLDFDAKKLRFQSP